MPYIKLIARERLANAKAIILNAGELNYLLTRECQKWPQMFIRVRLWVIVRRYLSAQILNYETLNSVMGALEGCKREYVRRVGENATVVCALNDVQDDFYEKIVAPYEQGKIAENGDVFG